MAKKGSELRVEELVGTRISDRDGRVVGRLEELRATREGDHWVVTEFDIGAGALLERLASRHFGITWPGRVRGYRASWDQLNFEDPHHLTLRCPMEELKKLR